MMRIKGDQGSGTVVMIALVAAALIATLAIVAVMSTNTARWQAQSDADMGAIAAATVHRDRIWKEEQRDPCRSAQAITSVSDNELEKCLYEGEGIYLVEVRRSVTIFGVSWDAHAIARAGPEKNE